MPTKFEAKFIHFSYDEKPTAYRRRPTKLPSPVINLLLIIYYKIAKQDPFSKDKSLSISLSLFIYIKIINSSYIFFIFLNTCVYRIIKGKLLIFILHFGIVKIWTLLGRIYIEQMNRSLTSKFIVQKKLAFNRNQIINNKPRYYPLNGLYKIITIIKNKQKIIPLFLLFLDLQIGMDKKKETQQRSKQG